MSEIFNNEIECIKDVIMYDGNVKFFTKGKRYKANTQGEYKEAINNLGEMHGLGNVLDEDRFFKDHFIIVN